MILETLEIEIPSRSEPVKITFSPPLSVNIQPGERLTLLQRGNGFDLLFPCGRIVPIDVVMACACGKPCDVSGYCHDCIGG